MIEATYPGYMFVDTNGQPIEIKNAYKSIDATTADQSVIAAVTGKKIRVLSIIARDDGAGTEVVLKTAAGTPAMRFYVNVNTSFENTVFDLNPLGWMDSAAGGAITADGGAAAVKISIRYIEFTQPT